MELREKMKFNDHGDIIELSYYDEDDDGYVTWIDTNGNNWEDGYILSGLKSNNLQLISYPYEVGDYVIITRYQNGSELGTVVELTTICSHSVYYADIDNYPGLRFESNVNYIRPAFQNEINNIKKQKEMKETKFKVGDWVKITKSDSNWNSQMDKFDGQIVQITYITSDNSIRFKNDGTWQWEYKNNHFVKVDGPKALLSPEEQEQIMLNHDLEIYDSIPVKGSNPTITHIHEGYTITTPSVKYDTTSMKVMALDYSDFITGSSSPTISIIKPKNKKSMFKSDIVSFK